MTPLEKGLIKGEWKVKYLHTITPVEVLSHVRFKRLKFDTPEELEEAFSKVAVYHFDMGYDDGYGDCRAQMQDRIRDVQGLGG